MFRWADLAGTFLRVPNLLHFFVYGPFFSNRYPKYGEFPGLSETGLKTVRRLGVPKLEHARDGPRLKDQRRFCSIF